MDLRSNARRKTSATKRQHYLPRFYLRRFTDTKGKLWAYSADRGRLFRTSPENVCVEKLFYEALDTKGRPLFENLIEKQLERIENRLAPHFDQLLECCEKGVFRGEDFQRGRLAACEFASNALCRNPFIIGRMRRDADRIADEIVSESDTMTAHAQKLKELDMGEYLDLYGELKLMSLTLGRESGPGGSLYQMISAKRFTVLEAADTTPFITASPPLVMSGFRKKGPECVFAFMPLSSRFAAFFSEDQNAPAYAKIMPSNVMRLNNKLLTKCILWDTAICLQREPLEYSVYFWANNQKSIR